MKTSTHRSVLRAAASVAVALFCSLPGLVQADENEPPHPDTDPKGDAAIRISEKFTAFAGSTDNANALVTGLHAGSAITLTSTVDGVTTTTEFQPATGQLGYGNTYLALALAQESLTKAGITQPTPAQIVAALNGGAVTGANGAAVNLAGVLALRATGQGWGDIAQTLGVKLGQLLHHEHAETPPAPKSVRIAGKFTAFAGSTDNANALVTGLHAGSAITLTSTVDGVTTTTEFQPATGKLGYGGISRSLSLAEKSLAKLGITQPTPAQIISALNGGTVTGANGTAVNLAGVLALRAAGQGWGQIARILEVRPDRHTPGFLAKTPHAEKPMEPVAANSQVRLAGSFEQSPSRPAALARPDMPRPVAPAQPAMPNLNHIPRAGRH